MLEVILIWCESNAPSSHMSGDPMVSCWSISQKMTILQLTIERTCKSCISQKWHFSCQIFTFRIAWPSLRNKPSLILFELRQVFERGFGKSQVNVLRTRHASLLRFHFQILFWLNFFEREVLENGFGGEEVGCI